MSEDILRLVYAAIDEVDARTSDGTAVERSPEAALLGNDKGVDSLTFVNLVVAIEQLIDRDMGKSVVLVDEDSMVLEEHPFRTVGTLAVYTEKVIARQ